ncbi:hypothetical protein [Bacteriovorax sp. Seq25_V]|uniref:hypothetical protein n=1 Tax=Bacteriovorax sp. Seq25_V TaxID=1201288 RepID=UPI00038A1762|nr:hypothetical protein [Bacteriovorax sp. Seq25_V]EQC46891.1 hypothetical protein M900_2598 [Bacteriovorax sp. Seq25_V]
MKELLVFLSICSLSSLAGIKEDFVEQVKKECGKSEDEASALATPGRAGNVIKYKLCPQNPVVVSEDCKLSCSASAGNVVGN